MPHKSISRVTVDCKKRNLIEWVKNRSQDLMLKKSGSSRCDLYKINICGQENDGCLPKVVLLFQVLLLYVWCFKIKRKYSLMKTQLIPIFVILEFYLR